MAYDSKGRLVLSHNLSTRETLDMIAECLGDFRISTLGGRDVGMLCTSPKVNPNSKNKPFHAVQNRFKVQTDEDKKMAAYGYYWFLGESSDYSNAPAAHSAIGLIEQAKKLSGQWQFKPLDCYRAWDFDGYHHSAKNPYKYENTNTNPAATDRHPNVRYQEGDEYTESISLSDMPHPNNALTPVDWWSFHIVAVVCYNNRLENLQVIDTGLTVKYLEETPDDFAVADVFLPQLTSGSRVYDFLWAATNVDVSDSSNLEYGDNNWWIFLPESYTTWLQMATRINVNWNIQEGGFQFRTNADGRINYLALYLNTFSPYNYDVYYNWVLTVWRDGMELEDGAEYRGSNRPDTGNTVDTLLRIVPNDLSYAPVDTPENTIIALTLNAYRADTNALIGTYFFDPIGDNVVNGEATTADGWSVREIYDTLYDSIE